MKKCIGLLLGLVIGVSCPVFAATLSGGAGAAPASGGNGYTASLGWTQGSSCSLTGVTCTSNMYSCVGTCVVNSGQSPSGPYYTGCTSTTSTWNKIGSTISGATYTDSAPAGGVVSYCVTDVATGSGWSGTESGPSNVFTLTFPVAPPTGLAGTHN